MTEPTYRHTPNSNDVRHPLDGTRLINVQPMSEEFYDREETGPMYTAEAEGFDGVLHLFADEINNLPPDYAALSVTAYKQRQDANERFQQARADSQTASLRELVFTAASYGVTRLLLEPSDQGPYMLVSEIEPELDGEAEDIIGDSGAMDLPDYDTSDWLSEAGVELTEADQRSEQIRKATIDVKVAAEALLAEPAHPALSSAHQAVLDLVASEVQVNAEASDANTEADIAADVVQRLYTVHRVVAHDDGEPGPLN